MKPAAGGRACRSVLDIHRENQRALRPEFDAMRGLVRTQVQLQGITHLVATSADLVDTARDND